MTLCARKTVVVIRVLGTVAAGLAMASAHAAGNLVANGDFASGNFNGWTFFGATDSEDIGATGSYHYAYFGQVGATGGIAQTLSTVPGAHYSFSFLLANMGSTANAVNVSWNGSSLLALVNAGAFAARPYTFDVLASSPATGIAFAFRNDPASFHMTNVSVLALAPVPEPQAPAMLLAGAGVIGVVLRRFGLQARGATTAPWMPWRASASATKPEAFISST